MTDDDICDHETQRFDEERCGSTGRQYILNRELMQDLGGVVESKKPIPFDMVREGKVGFSVEPCYC